MTHVLTLVRHAKSSWDHPGLADIDRPLNKRGLKNAPEMGKCLAQQDYKVDMIISSSAVRAISTAEFIASEINFNLQKIVQNEKIYEAGLSTLLEVIANLDDDSYRVMLVGHNPSFTFLCNYLSDSDIDNMPTCSIAQIQFDVDSWGSVSKHSGKLIDFNYPKKGIRKP